MVERTLLAARPAFGAGMTHGFAFSVRSATWPGGLPGRFSNGG